MSPEQRSDFVERFARMLEETGHSRIAGRIFAHLATADEPYLSQQDLVEQLQVSAASVSTNTRQLIVMNLLTRVAVPGSRREHYALIPDGSRRAAELAVRNARRVAALADEGLALLPDTVSAGTQSLRAMRETYTGMASAIESVVVEPLRIAQ